MMIIYLNPFASELRVTMVKVRVIKDPDPNEGTIWFDYFLVNGTRIPNLKQSSSRNKSKNIGAVVGGVIGGVFCLIVIVALALVALRMKKIN